MEEMRNKPEENAPDFEFPTFAPKDILHSTVGDAHQPYRKPTPAQLNCWFLGQLATLLVHVFFIIGLSGAFGSPPEGHFAIHVVLAVVLNVVLYCFFSCKLLYHMWALQPRSASFTSPSWAVFSFCIPVYQAYWFFAFFYIVIKTYAEDLRQLGARPLISLQGALFALILLLVPVANVLVVLVVLYLLKEEAIQLLLLRAQTPAREPDAVAE